jgi:hypothetical protein
MSGAGVPLPGAAPETGADHLLTVAAHEEQVLLLADDGTQAEFWVSSG